MGMLGHPNVKLNTIFPKLTFTFLSPDNWQHWHSTRTTNWRVLIIEVSNYCGRAMYRTKSMPACITEAAEAWAPKRTLATIARLTVDPYGSTNSISAPRTDPMPRPHQLLALLPPFQRTQHDWLTHGLTAHSQMGPSYMTDKPERRTIGDT